MVSSRVLDNKTLITIDSLVLNGLLDGPLANVCPFLLRAGCVLLCVRGLPSLVPIVGELLKEVGLKCGRSECGKLVRNGGRSLLNVLSVDVARKHGSRHGHAHSSSEPVVSFFA
jgi:hypothetical protein